MLRRCPTASGGDINANPKQRWRSGGRSPGTALSHAERGQEPDPCPLKIEEPANGFLPHRCTNTGVVLPDKHGVDQVVPFEKAVSRWLRALRSAQHGFGGRDEAGKQTVPSAHGADIAWELPDLAWLFLLVLVTSPERLRCHGGQLT